MSDSTACARALIGQLLAQGVADVVLAPGSRSAPLALCLEATARAGRLRLHVRIDERSAGFLALGLAKAGRRPVAVVTTSGTAVGNLLPAVMEAYHAAVPLVVVSADRPGWMVGFGANQTTQQVGLFAGFLSYSASVSALAPRQSWLATAARAVLLATGATGGRPGPAHLNVELPEPLVEAGVDVEADSLAPVLAGARPDPVVEHLGGQPRTVVLCGDATTAVGTAAIRLAERAGLPVVAEPSSNARAARTAMSCGRLLLGTALGEQIQRVLVFGRPTLSRPVAALLSRADVEVVVVADRADYPDPGWRAGRVVGAVDVAPGPPEWLDAWRAADTQWRARIEAAVAEVDHLTGLELAEAVLASVASEGIVCLGNSNAIRDADLCVVPPAGSCFANRGLSGIDGTVATAIGIALASGRETTLLCGDLSFVHDAAALAIAGSEPRPRLRIVVADDDGGSIFATLEYGDPAFAVPFERVFATPTGLDLVALAQAYQVGARRVATAAEVERALAAPITGIEVIVVEVDRTGRRDLMQRINLG